MSQTFFTVLLVTMTPRDNHTLVEYTYIFGMTISLQ